MSPPRLCVVALCLAAALGTARTADEKTPMANSSAAEAPAEISADVKANARTVDALWKFIQKYADPADLEAVVSDPKLSQEAKLAKLNEIERNKEAHLEPAIEEMLERYPHDLRRWDARIIRAQFTMDALSEADIVRTLQEVAAAPDAAHATRRQAERLLRLHTANAKAPVEPLAIPQPLDLKFTALDGREVDFAKLRGKVVLLDFWATWCRPCMAKLPEIQALSQKYKDASFEVIGISLDDDRAALERTVKAKKMEWPEYFDDKGWDGDLVERFGVASIPATFLVDKNGKVFVVSPNADLDAEVAKLLAAPRDTQG